MNRRFSAAEYCPIVDLRQLASFVECLATAASFSASLPIRFQKGIACLGRLSHPRPKMDSDFA